MLCLVLLLGFFVSVVVVGGWVSGENGVYYTVSFDWRTRESEAEKQQLDLIAAFMSAYKEQLIDIEGTSDLTCVDGWTAQQLQALTAQRIELGGNQNRSLPAA